MTAILILAGIIVVLGLAAYILQRHFHGDSKNSETVEKSEAVESSDGSKCCGMHAVCESSPTQTATSSIR